MRVGYSSTGLFSPKYNVIAGGNDQLCFTLKDVDGTVQWSKIKVKPQGASSPVIYLGSYVPPNPGTNYFTVCIPLSVFTANDFTQISNVELQCNNAAAFEIHIQKIEFTGGATPFLWFGDPKTDNYHDGGSNNGSNLLATLVPGSPCGGGAKMDGSEIGQQFTNTGSETAFLNAYPNPFSEMVNIEFSLANEARVRVEIVNLEGKLISELFEGTVKGGEVQSYQFHSGTLANGMYFYRLITEDGEIHNRKLILNR